MTEDESNPWRDIVVEPPHIDARWLLFYSPMRRENDIVPYVVHEKTYGTTWDSFDEKKEFTHWKYLIQPEPLPKRYTFNEISAIAQGRWCGVKTKVVVEFFGEGVDITINFSSSLGQNVKAKIAHLNDVYEVIDGKGSNAKPPEDN